MIKDRKTMITEFRRRAPPSNWDRTGSGKSHGA